jgi:hypothetical protein
MRLKPSQLLPPRALWHECCSDKVTFNDGRGMMLQDGAVAAGVLSFLPGDSAAVSLVWLLVIVGLIGPVVSLFKR